jgi:ABC-type multidrug transport system ATPase subunit
MEEAEALCDRIGIMARGTLRCIAAPLRLKELYGNGYRLTFNALQEENEKAKTFIESLLPIGWKNLDSFATTSTYEFPAPKGVLSKLFKEVENGKGKNGILDWGVGQTTLEEVFVKKIGEDEAGG